MGHHAKVPYNCENCGKEFQALAYRRKKGQSRFCSKECCLDTQRNQKPVTCKWCKQVFTVKESRLKRKGKNVSFCSRHCQVEYMRQTKTNIFSDNKTVLSGSDNPNWKGGVVQNCGYKLIKKRDLDPKSFSVQSHGYIREHRYVVEKALGRRLKNNEIIHHINLNKKDNRLENLMVLQSDEEHVFVHYLQETYSNWLNLLICA